MHTTKMVLGKKILVIISVDGVINITRPFSTSIRRSNLQPFVEAVSGLGRFDLCYGNPLPYYPQPSSSNCPATAKSSNKVEISVGPLHSILTKEDVCNAITCPRSMLKQPEVAHNREDSYVQNIEIPFHIGNESQRFSESKVMEIVTKRGYSRLNTIFIHSEDRPYFKNVNRNTNSISLSRIPDTTEPVLDMSYEKLTRYFEVLGKKLDNGHPIDLPEFLREYPFEFFQFKFTGSIFHRPLGFTKPSSADQEVKTQFVGLDVSLNNDDDIEDDISDDGDDDDHKNDGDVDADDIEMNATHNRGGLPYTTKKGANSASSSDSLATSSDDFADGLLNHFLCEKLERKKIHIHINDDKENAMDESQDSDDDDEEDEDYDVEEDTEDEEADEEEPSDDDSEFWEDDDAHSMNESAQFAKDETMPSGKEGESSNVDMIPKGLYLQRTHLTVKSMARGGESAEVRSKNAVGRKHVMDDETIDEAMEEHDELANAVEKMSVNTTGK